MPFDVDKLIAERPKPSRKKPFSFTFDGEDYPLPNEVDAIAVRAAATGDWMTSFTRLLTPEQFLQIQRSSKVLELDVIGDILSAYYQHLGGTSAGESAASSTRSKNTARPSKQTSKRTTASRSRR